MYTCMYFMRKQILFMVKKYGKGRERTERVKGMSNKELHIRSYRYCGDKEWEKGVVFMGSNNDATRIVRR